MLAPANHISDEARRHGLGWLIVDGAAATAIGALNSGVVLLALALHVGASNAQIGVIAAIPLLSQMLQAPTVTLVERVRRRRLIAVACLFTARLALPLYAMVPFIPAPRIAVLLLIAAAMLHYGLNAVAACAWNSWIRDLVPGDRLGRFFARRQIYGTAVSTAATITAALALGLAEGQPGRSDAVFAGLYLAGFAFGLVSTFALARVPEPLMTGSTADTPLRRLLAMPFADGNFRNLLRYVASWQFAVNLATPFFTVYMVRNLGFTMSFVLVLTVISQLASLAAARIWGGLSDRFTNKSVLSLACPLFIACIGGMAITGDLGSMAAQAAWLVLLHIIMGAAGAGIGLAANNMAMKLSPAGAGTAFMAASALAAALAAGAAPMVGGVAADMLAVRRLELRLTWSGPDGTERLFGLALSQWEFFFLVSAALGLYALHRLSLVEERDAVDRREIVHHMWTAARRSLANASSVAGLRMGLAFPGGELLRLRRRDRFVLEERFARDDAAATREGIGALLGAAFDQPRQGGEWQALLNALDRDTPPR